MKIQILAFAAALLFQIPAVAAERLKVITTTTDLAWAAQRIGGSHVEVTPLLTGNENAHYVDAVPRFIRLVADADVVCVVGLDLEIGWIPKVLSKSGNAKVQPGGAGYCELGKRITAMEKPKGSVDRSMGDVHPGGNPHFWLSPLVFAEASEAVFDALSSVAPERTKDFAKGYAGLKEELTLIHAQNKKRIHDSLGKSPKVAQYHSNFSYYLEAMGLVNLGTVEEVPGQHPSAGRIAQFGLKLKENAATAVFAVDYDPEKVLTRFHKISEVPIVVVSDSIRPDQKSLSDYAKLMDHMTSEFIKVAAAKKVN